MASSGVLAAGVTSYSSTLVASTADTVTFTDRYGYVSVANTGTGIIYVRLDGTAATVAGASCYAVMAGEVAMFANGLPLWYPSSRVIQKGVNQFGGGNTATSPTDPGTVTPMESLAGQMVNPGTSVSLISSGTPTYTVSAAG